MTDPRIEHAAEVVRRAVAEVTFLGLDESLAVAEALRGVYLRASRIRFLGSWPRVVGEPTPVRDARIAAAQEWVEAVRSGRAR